MEHLLERIYDNEDKLLFEEAVACYNCDAFRASYVFLWISCAESIKRRFKLAKIRDGNALRISSEIQRKEENHQSIDKYLLDQAMKYGFINDPEHHHLLRIYENRCLFGHPYELKPLREQIKSAAAEIVEFVLSKPLKLKHGYIISIIDNLISYPNYIDNTDEAVQDFVNEMISKFDESLHLWFVETFTKRIEEIEDDLTQNKVRLLGYNILEKFLKSVDLSFMTDEEWHRFVLEHNKTSINVLLCSELFLSIGQRASNYLVAIAIDLSIAHPSILSFFNYSLDKGLLSDRHVESIKEYILIKPRSIETAKFILDSNLDIRLTYDKIIDLLISHNWYMQNHTIEYLLNLEKYEYINLKDDELVVLGRNIYQSADGGSEKAVEFLNIKDIDYPDYLYIGLVLECFVREDFNIRSKFKLIKLVHTIIEEFEETRRNEIITKVCEYVGRGKMDEYYRMTFHPVIQKYLDENPLFAEIFRIFDSLGRI